MSAAVGEHTLHLHNPGEAQCGNTRGRQCQVIAEPGVDDELNEVDLTGRILDFEEDRGLQQNR
jgi:hypothetical protein